ncbi:replication-associated recombination protein A [Verrucomicrobium sp. 3C]|uniref:replication-associated recombination protein A n=1 Tax=Verrucomicrobium sp. 3C TaxID=1134055 RepID=UPI000373DED4|nr:replication-associated recombination protein A [Verrucomicrobium sp. 3C]
MTASPVAQTAPLAVRLRPQSLEEIVGQESLLAPGKPLRRLVDADRLGSVILFGPPGSGKTSFAEAVARATSRPFERLNAADSGVPELRRILERASLHYSRRGEPTVFFLDEIHRFNRAQQDALLSGVEGGAIWLIGATTHNPCFALSAPLLSRSRVFEFAPLAPAQLDRILSRALEDSERGLGRFRCRLDPLARQHFLATAEGDARRLLNALEVAILSTPPSPEGIIEIDVEAAEHSCRKKMPRYDRDQDEHYDTISAFIKSVRGGDPDSSLYWLAKMLVAGEDPRFIARRLVILAAEDIGLAEPSALSLAVAACHAIEQIGMPEGRIPLAEAAVYLATLPKSNSAYSAIHRAIEAVEKGESIPVPPSLRDAHYAVAAGLGRGVGYQYSHDFPEAISPQDFGVVPGRFYQPTNRGGEKEISERLKRWRALRSAAPREPAGTPSSSQNQ